jgi:hypothetical protein
MLERRRKLIYWGTYGAVIAVFVGGMTALTALAGARNPNPAVFIGRATGIIGAAVAACVVRRLGLSLEAKTEDVVAGAEVQAGPGLREGQAVVHGGRTRWVVGVAITLSVAAGAGMMNLAHGGGGLLLLPPAVVFAGLSVLCWHRFRKDPGILAQADASGITGRHRRRMRSIPWTEVGRCEIKRQYDVLGRPTSIVCVVHDKTGAEALSVDLTQVPEAECQQFLDMVKGSGKTAYELEAADAPDGRGTELTAAQEPAGRGTELTAAGEPAPPPAEIDATEAPPTVRLPGEARRGR